MVRILRCFVVVFISPLAFISAENIPFCVKYSNEIKLNIYSVWHDYMFILLLLLLFYYWLPASASNGHHQANIYTKCVEIKCQLDATDDFYCRSYCLLNVFRAPLCPSSGAPEYYTGGCCLWYLLLWFSSCRYGVELRVMCPVCS